MPDALKRTAQSQSVIAFDGVCVLCHGFVRFILRRDRAGLFRFASTTSAEGARLFAESGQDPGQPSSVILAEGGRIYSESDAILRAVGKLGGVWRAAPLLRVVPRPVRDWAYRAIATRRYRLFGKLDACSVPPPEWRDRFLP